MRAITLPEFGGPEALTPAEVTLPPVKGRQVRLRVVAAGVNRADLLQRQGYYPPPVGESEVPGLEVSGVIEEVGRRVTAWQVGDEVCALLSGGGYAEQVVVPEGQLLPVPAGVSLADAAALPEVACTVWSNVVQVAGLRSGEWLLVHGGSSGIGTMAIQVARALGAHVVVTVGSDEKAAFCRELGADVVVNYREADFVDAVHEACSGADVILDNMGGKYLERNVSALGVGGRLVIIGMQGGTRGELPIGQLLAKRALVTATSLRARPKAQKAEIVAAVREHVWPWIEAGTVRPVIAARFGLESVAEAHRLMESSEHRGKILLDV